MILKTRWKHGEKLQAKPLRSFVIDDRRRRRRSEGTILIDAFKLLSRFFHEKKKRKAGFLFTSAASVADRWWKMIR